MLVGFNFLALPLQAGTIWQIAGQQALVLEDPDNEAANRIARWNQRLADIVSKLDPNQPWVVDILPPSVPNSSPELIKSVVIRLQGQPLMEVREKDARANYAGSAMELANTWVRSLTNLLSQQGIRETLTATAGLPYELSYGGAIYYLKAQITGDRGLFRTNGQRVNGKVIFWEVPADNKAYQITSSNSPQVAPPTSSPLVIYVLNQNLYFIPYTRQRN